MEMSRTEHLIAKAPMTPIVFSSGALQGVGGREQQQETLGENIWSTNKSIPAKLQGRETFAQQRKIFHYRSLDAHFVHWLSTFFPQTLKHKPKLKGHFRPGFNEAPWQSIEGL